MREDNTVKKLKANLKSRNHLVFLMRAQTSQNGRHTRGRLIQSLPASGLQPQLDRLQRRRAQVSQRCLCQLSEQLYVVGNSPIYEKNKTE